MEELIRILGDIAEKTGGDWKELVLIDNDTDNPLVDAYNDGVRAMASQVCGLVSVIACAKATEYRLKEGEK
jgi:hypothetical protein